jgi:hypothetical protein
LKWLLINRVSPLDPVFEKQELVDEFFRPFQPPGIIDLWTQPERVFLNADEGLVDRTKYQLLDGSTSHGKWKSFRARSHLGSHLRGLPPTDRQTGSVALEKVLST